MDLIDCSSGGIEPTVRIPSIHPGYQVPFAERIRAETGMATGAVGMIRSPEMAAEIVANERADLVFVGAGGAGRSRLAAAGGGGAGREAGAGAAVSARRRVRKRRLPAYRGRTTGGRT